MASRLQRLRRTPAGETFPLAGPAFRRAAPWLLLASMVLGLLTRLHPAFRYAVWGSDSGEYYFLTHQLVETGRVLFAYDGWGIAYPYFPGMFILSGAAHAVLGVEEFTAVQFTVPVLAALVPVLVGLFAYRVTRDPRAGVLAGIFVAVTAPVVITTSHAMPGTLGHVFLLAILVLLPDAFRDRRFWPVLILSGAALVLTHHLSTYFVVGIIAFSAFARELVSRRAGTRRLTVEIPLVLTLLGMAAFWWLGVAAPFREDIVGDALNLSPILTTLLFIGALGALPALVYAKRRMLPAIWKPRYHSFRRQGAAIIGIFAGVALLITFFIFTKVPGTNIDVGWPSLIYVLPVLGFIAFVPPGIGAIRFHRHGMLAVGWLYAILASLIFSIATNNHVLFPFRHIDYMVEAMAPLAAVGMLMFYDQMLAARVPADRPRARAALATAFALIVVSSTLLSLPPRETLGGFEEGTTHAEWAAVGWMERTLPPGTTLAADHRISSLAWGYGEIHATWDEAYVTYHSETAEEAIADLANLRTPVSGVQRIDYVFMSPVLEAGVTLLQWETSAPMSPAAVAKFADERYFEKVYDEAGVQVYRVKWESLPLDATPPADPAVEALVAR